MAYNLGESGADVLPPAVQRHVGCTFRGNQVVPVVHLKAFGSAVGDDLLAVTGKEWVEFRRLRVLPGTTVRVRLHHNPK